MPTLLLALSLGGCSSVRFGDSSNDTSLGSSADSTTQDACGPYAAIEEGRTWTWALKTAGTVPSAMTQTVTEFDGKRGVLQSEAETGGAAMHFRCDGGLVFDYVEYWSPGGRFTSYEDDPQPSIPASLAVGDEWTVEYKGTTVSDSGTNRFNYTVMSQVTAEESHTVEAGTWNAFRIRQTKDTGEVSYDWLVAGVGLIEYSGAELADWNGSTK